ncbi:MAG: hypothetical protein WC525_06270 [Candidatus Thermoplasmatota archaeon]
MRISSLVKNTFCDMTPTVKIITKAELERKIKTKKVLIDVNAVTKIFGFFASRGNIEAVCLLQGRLCGEYLLIKDAHLCTNAKATSVHVTIPTESFAEAAADANGNYVIGWAHSHPGFAVFMSPTDEATQKDFQALFSDAVAMVMNPFSAQGIEFKFFRYHDGKLEKMKYDFLVSRDD